MPQISESPNKLACPKFPSQNLHKHTGLSTISINFPPNKSPDSLPAHPAVLGRDLLERPSTPCAFDRTMSKYWSDVKRSECFFFVLNIICLNKYLHTYNHFYIYIIQYNHHIWNMIILHWRIRIIRTKLKPWRGMAPNSYHPRLLVFIDHKGTYRTGPLNTEHHWINLAKDHQRFHRNIRTYWCFQRFSQWKLNWDSGRPGKRERVSHHSSDVTKWSHNIIHPNI